MIAATPFLAFLCLLGLPEQPLLIGDNTGLTGIVTQISHDDVGDILFGQ